METEGGFHSEEDSKLQRPQDELLFWKGMRDKGVGDDKKRADVFLKIYQYEGMDEKWRNISKQEIPELKDLIDVTIGVLD